MGLDVSYDIEWVTARIPQPKGISRIRAKRSPRTIDDLANADESFAFALAHARTIAGDVLDDVRTVGDAIYLRHRVLASLDSESAEVLGLPALVDLTFKTDVEGLLGSPSFRLQHQWTKYGRPQVTRRVGSILETEDGIRRLPFWLLEAIEVAEGFTSESNLSEHWGALARFRRALEPEEAPFEEEPKAQVAMTDFLKGLEVRLADSFGLTPKKDEDGLLDFDPVPFSRRAIEDVDEEKVSEDHGELTGEALLGFTDRFRARGALPAYRVGQGSYLVVDPCAHVMLEVMAEKQHASPEERNAFIRNPTAAIAEATATRMRENGELEGLSAESEEEAIEAATIDVFTETTEFSERVIGTTIYQNPQFPGFESSELGWMPESFDQELIKTLEKMDDDSLDEVIHAVQQAVSEGQILAIVGELEIPASEASVKVLEYIRDSPKEPEEDDEGEEQVTEGELKGPVILDTEENFVDLDWYPAVNPRDDAFTTEDFKGVVTPLKKHQHEGLIWQKECWSAGLPGVLNADEQGLGKTLQTIAFVRSLQEWQKGSETGSNKQPTLIVAPTSLLLTWEAEVRTHLDERGLGNVIRLFGATLGGYKKPNASGFDTTSGVANLDLSELVNAIEKGQGEQYWVLTTYTTLTNYHHSLARIPFAVAVFDEIQALKNPGSLRSFAARSINADFRIGLTGTPIENQTSDLWAVLDQLSPGTLGTMLEFNQMFSEPDKNKMETLYNHVFKSIQSLPPMALRRLKAEVATDLPPKLRRLHPRLMPPEQMAAYDAAQLKLKNGMNALQSIQHVRAVSVHPDLVTRQQKTDFVTSSGRMAATFELLQQIQERNERVLVFIEERVIQHWFIDIVRRKFGLERVDLINGSTPIPLRQAIVERFQRHINDDRGFDLLVLGTKAAGTGLTLTAATHVIHVSRWWNPAVEEQCNDRVHRIGQEKPVTIHIPMAVHPKYRERSFDCLLHSLMNRKRKLADAALWPMGETAADIASLQRGVAGNKGQDSFGDPISVALKETFKRDGNPEPHIETDGSVSYL